MLGGQKASSQIQTYTVEEKFGVSHPQQIIDFDPPASYDPTSSYMVGPLGSEVPYQVLSNGHLAVMTDLPAGARRTWTLQSGRPSASSSSTGLTLSVQPGYYEITNGKTGVRILRAEAGMSPDTRLAPIQGLLLANGVWAANGNNLIYKGAQTKLDPLPALTVTSKIVERGPLQVTVELDYTYNRPDLYYGSRMLLAGGSGYYKSVITLQAAQPSVLIDDDTNMDLQYFLDFYSAVKPDQARYRGHLATDLEFGHTADGKPYVARGTSIRPADSDAFRDLQYNTPMYPSYVTSRSSGMQSVHRIPAWDPWVNDGGWYWMLYNKGGDDSAPLIGAFAGPASKAAGIGPGITGPGVFTVPASGNAPQAAGFSFSSNRLSPDGRVFQRCRMAWGLFTGTKGADLADSLQVQNINRQMNLYGGFNLNKVYRYPTVFPDPPNGFGALYLNSDALLKKIARVQNDTNYYKSLLLAAPDSRNLVEMWRDPSGAKAKLAAAEVMDYAHRMLDAMINGNGIYQFGMQYWGGGQEMSQRAAIINTLMVQNILSPADREQLKAVAVLFASILWDPDFVPLDNKDAGVGLGTANMPVQQVGYRNQYTLLLAGHPMMQPYLNSVQSDAINVINQTINVFGAHQGSTNYIQAGMAPTLSVLEGLQTNAGIDLFKMSDRLVKFGDFYMNLLTPPEPRFGNTRKLVSIGDATTTFSELYGVLATGFAPSNPLLSQRLMEAWIEDGSMNAANSGTTLVKIDDTLPATDMGLGSANYPGWCSILRNATGTPNETAVWFVNGAFYSDHRHDDGGSVVIYALGNPLSIDWGSVYSPRTAGAFMHSMVLPESALTQPWDADNAPFDPTPSPVWNNPQQNSFVLFDNSTAASATQQSANGTTWTRSVYSIHPNPAFPAIVIRDRFDGPDGAAPKISTLNLMSQASVDTPSGPVIPPLRLYQSNGDRKEKPSASPSFSLQAGLNHFGFTGQWGIDWDLYTMADENQQALIGNWAHDSTTSVESGQFNKANGMPFRERQNIFRLRGSSGFNVMILPYAKGGAPSRQVTSDGTATVITTNYDELRIDTPYFGYNAGNLTLLTTFTSDAASAYGITVSGGQTEVSLSGSQLTVVAHGGDGVRRVIVPGNWNLNELQQDSDGSILFPYTGPDPMRWVLTAAGPAVDNPAARKQPQANRRLQRQ